MTKHPLIQFLIIDAGSTLHTFEGVGIGATNTGLLPDRRGA